MEILIKDRNCIITPLSQRLDKHESYRLAEEIKNHLLFNIGINLSNVEDCTIDFIEVLKTKKEVGVFNISPEIFAVLNLMGIDKTANLFVSENDFKFNSNRILKRNFKLV